MTSADVTKIVMQALRDPGFIESPYKYSGVFRGFVEDVTDPEARGRVRVRVPSVHGDVPTYALPWAERCLPDAGGNYGDVIPLKAGTYAKPVARAVGFAADGPGEPEVVRHTGDPVFVMFEGGDRHLPIVLGGFNVAGEGPVEASPGQQPGHRRRRIVKSRHGTRVEFGDENDHLEWKVVTPLGHVIHMREAEGGRGIHITTQGGHTLSLQDEDPGVRPPFTLRTAYDLSPDTRFDRGDNDRSVPREVPVPPSGEPDGVPRSPTPGVGSGVGHKGVMLKSSSGHRVLLSDSGDFVGAKVETNAGHTIVLTDSGAAAGVRIDTVAGNYARLTDGDGIVLHSQHGQELRMTATSFGLFYNGMDIQFGFGTVDSPNRWKITGNLAIDVTGALSISAIGNIDIVSQARLREVGATRVESPPIGP